MLLSINLPLAELSTVRGELPAQPGLPNDFTRPRGGFADLLGQRVMATATPDTLRGPVVPQLQSGDVLPVEGKDLPPPAPDWGLELPSAAAGTVAMPPLPWLPGTEMTGPTVENGHQGSAAAASNAKSVAGLLLDASKEATLQRGSAVPIQQGPGGSPVVAPAAAPGESHLLAATAEFFPVSKTRQGPGFSAVDAAGLDDDLSGSSASDADGPETLQRGMDAVRNVRQSAARDGVSPRLLFDRADMARNPAEPGSGTLAVSGAAGTTDLMPRVPSMPVDVIGVAAPVANSHVAAASRAPVAILPPIDLALQDPAWGDSLNERVTIMAGKDIGRAEIRLNPAELGPIRVQLSVDDRGTSVSFTAQHPQTRDAIEQALPRLRELFGEQGLSLGQTSVSDQGVQQDRNGRDADGLPRQSAAATSDDTDSVPVAAIPARIGTGLVDTFA